MSETVLIVTPVWNDSTRLADFAPSLAKEMADSELNLRWVIADDGSTEQEVERLKAIQEQHRATFPEIEIHRAEHRTQAGVEY